MLGTNEKERTMADNDDDAAIERLAKKIFEMQNPGKEWRPGASASAEDQKRYRALAKQELGTKDS
jgi:hypothetical protein